MVSLPGPAQAQPELEEGSAAEPRVIDILFVDDSQSDVDLAVRLLERGGLRVIPCRVDSAGPLTTALVDARWDVIITDFALPGYSGSQAIQLCRKLAPQTPCLLVTGTLTLKEASGAVALGIVDFFTKDDLERLPRAVSREVDHSTRMRAAAVREDELNVVASALRAETERRAATLEVLFKLAVEASGELDVASLLPLACSSAASLLGAEHAGVALWNAARNTLEVAFDSAGQVPAGTPIEPGRGAAGRAFAGRLPVIVAEYLNLDQRLRAAPADRYRSGIAVPMIVGDQVLGTLSVFGGPGQTFVEDDGEELSLIAALVAPAIQATRLHATLRQKELEQAALAEIGSQVLIADDPGAVLASAVPILGRRLAAMALALEPAADRESCSVVAVLGWPGYSAGETVSLDVQGLAGAPAGIATVIRTDERAAPAAGFLVPVAAAAGADTASVLTLRIDAEIAALLIVARAAGRPDFDAPELEFLRAAGEVITSAIRVKRAEQTAVRSEERLRFVVENAPLVLVSMGADGVVDFAAGQGLLDVGLTAAEIVGRPALGNLIGRGAANALGRALAGEEIIDTYRPRGSRNEWEIHYQPVDQSPGRKGGLVAVGLNVTERGEARRARLESATKSLFLATMSHELRTPLNSIIGFSQLLLDTRTHGMDAEQVRFIGNIRTSGERLLVLVNDLLDLSKVSAGRMEFSIGTVHLGQVIEAVAQQVSYLAAEKQIHFSVDESDGGGAQADSFRLSQVILNLLSNAIKYTPPGGHIAIRARQAGGQAIVEVHDDGPGIAQAFHEMIFDEFTPADSATHAKQGVGVGLSLSRSLARAMGGDLTVVSALGSGATFTVTLPAAA